VCRNVCHLDQRVKPHCDDDDDDDVSVTMLSLTAATNTASASSLTMISTADIQNTATETTTTTPEFSSGSTPSYLSSTVSDSFTGLQCVTVGTVYLKIFLMLRQLIFFQIKLNNYLQVHWRINYNFKAVQTYQATKGFHS